VTAGPRSRRYCRPSQGRRSWPPRRRARRDSGRTTGSGRGRERTGGQVLASSSTLPAVRSPTSMSSAEGVVKCPQYRTAAVPRRSGRRDPRVDLAVLRVPDSGTLPVAEPTARRYG
jgi:hypothetical protein